MSAKPKTTSEMKARRIADDILAFPALLGLSTRCLIRDVCARYGVGHHTAYAAVMLARAA